MAQSLFPVEQKLTPMMEQYRSIQKTLAPDTVLFFHLGDFYEMFFEDAVRASEILGITLTGRDAGPAGRVPMCGIPTHAFQQYVRLLLDRNLKVAVCEQIGDLQPAKGLVLRKITRIITPATYLDEETKPPQAEYLLAVAAESSRCALAALDLGTGEFFVREVDRARLPNELSLLQPREVILSKSFSRESQSAELLKENGQATVTVYEDWIFEAREGARLLKEGFALASERVVSFHDRPLAVSAVGAVLYYLKDHLQPSLGHLRLPVLLEARDFMALDRQTVRSLELVSGTSLLGCLDQTLTPMGSRLLRHWVLHPLLKLEAVLHRQEGTAELAAGPELLQALRSLLKGVRDVERFLSRLNCGVANARDLLGLKLFLERVPQLQDCLKETRCRILAELRGSMEPFPKIRELIERAIVEGPPLSLKEGGMIRDGYSAELDELRGLAAKGKSWLVEFERREAERTGIKSLRVRYNQVFGYSIEVSKLNLHRVPPEYQRRQTLANAERFVVPELVQWDEKISGAQEKIKDLEVRLFMEVRDRVLGDLAGLQAVARAVGELDALASLAFTAVRNQWVRPQVSDSLELEIKGGRHPVVEAMLPAGKFVENDAFLDGAGQQLIVLTGPNMAGKSTYLRQTALIVLLAQTGSFVPAKSARIGLVDRIFTRVGARDDLAHGESTFMVEMIEMAQILGAATGKSLLILDEVGRGTSTFDGVSLAWAICEHLAAGPVRPRTLFATHYHELIQLEREFPSVKNFTTLVRETPDGIFFLRKVAPGGSDRSYGIHVARLAGIPASVTQRAEEILKVLESEKKV
ncbi:MAG: DNA mismatch repair protein MutS [Candidatus Omnitrophota bacterium]|nr:DNA mismatch repair protein MutS [Candidatus Omnitrophota bacterium]